MTPEERFAIRQTAFGLAACIRNTMILIAIAVLAMWTYYAFVVGSAFLAARFVSCVESIGSY